jgi:hypothetical protein
VRLTRALKLVAAILVTAALGVTAASAFVPHGLALTPQDVGPVPGTSSLDQTAPDPEGGLGWTVRLSDSTAGGQCVEPGHAIDGRFGSIDPGGAFHELPLDEGGTCGDLSKEPVILVINAYPAGNDRPARTVLFGVASGDVAGISVTQPGGSANAHPVAGPRGGFLLPLAGTIAPQELPVTITLRDGRQIAYPWQ